MTEQPPSAVAQALADTIWKWPGYAFIDGRVAEAINALIVQRVAAETERCAQCALDGALLAEAAGDVRFTTPAKFAADLAKDIADAIRAPAERPAPPKEITLPISDTNDLTTKSGLEEITPRPNCGDQRLPCDVWVRHIKFGMGVRLQTLADAAAHWLAAAQQAERPAPEGPHPIRPTDSAVLHASLNALGPSHDGAVERDLAASTGEQPDEWVLVPRSPTTEMLKAAYDDARADDNPLNALDCWDSMIETAPAPPSPAAMGDYTERARELWQDLLDKDDRTSPPEYPEMALIYFHEFRDYLSAVASERDAAALLARLREPDVREAVIAAMREKDFARDGEYLPDDCYEAFAAAAIARLAEMLK